MAENDFSKEKSKVRPIFAVAGCWFAVVCALCVGAFGAAYAGYRIFFNKSGVVVPLGSEAPDFELSTLDGEIVRLWNYRGQPVLLSFGATWCGPCRTEMPIIQGVHESYPDLKVVMVDIGEDFMTVWTLANDLQLTYSIALDRNEEVARLYGIHSIPTMLLIDSSGVVRQAFVGIPSEAELADGLDMIGVAP